MLKFSVFLVSVLLILCCECKKEENSTRIAAGTKAKAGENLDFVVLTVIFQNQAQICGGTLIRDQFVLTSASCVSDPVEGIATVVNVTFPLSKKTKATKLAITAHADYAVDTHANNIAIVKLNAAVVPDGKTIKLATLATDTTADLYVGKALRVCGFGSIANYPTPSKAVECTDVFGVTAATCGANTGTICTKWSDRQNNICNGDYGSPAYLYVSVKNKVTSQTVVAIAGHSPDARPATSCNDGHMVEYTSVAAFSQWITDTLTAMA